MKLVRTTLVLGGALLLFTGCQDKKSGAAATSSATTTTAATLKPPATPIKAGQPFTVAWTGPNGPNDYVDVVAGGRPLQVGDEMAYVKTSAGNPSKLTAPAQPGTYDVRYVQDVGDRKVIAHTPITVVP